MSGYLDQYGAGDERREKIRKRMWVAAAFVVAGFIAWWFLFVWDKSEVVREAHVARFVQELRNRRQESEIRRFLDLVASHQYEAAYKAWGAVPQDYPFHKFMEDWGPQSSRIFSAYRIVRSRSCGSGVIVTVDLGKGSEESLWAQRSDPTLSFAPYANCPAKR